MAMEITPSAKSSFIAGFALAIVAWCTLFKLDQIPVLKRFVRKDSILDWMTDNKALTLIGTEVVNFGTHGITQSTAVTFALGSTVFNALMIFILLPFRRWRTTQTTREILNGGRL
jgi:hypothetical protein